MALMRQIVVKSLVHDCKLSDRRALLLSGKTARFVQDTEGQVEIFAKSVTNRVFGICKSKDIKLGRAAPELSKKLRPAMTKVSSFRVHIIEVVPSSLSARRETEVYLSIWGFAEDFAATS